MLRIAVLALVAAAGAAHAEDVAAYEVEGEADAGGADPRTAAADDAFARATQDALRELVAGDVRAQHKPELDREVVGRARLWVKKWSVRKDATIDGRRQLAITVRLDREKLRGKLAELGIPLIGESTGGPSHGAVVLLRVTQPSGVIASYGSSADKDAPGVAALGQVLHAAGFAIKHAGASGAAARGAGDLPLEEDEAATLAGDAKADAALVVGVTIGPPTQVRGVAGTASLVTAHVRFVDHGKGGITTSAVAAMFGDDPHAIERAVVAAATDAMPPTPPTLDQAAAFTGDDAPIATPGVVLVRLPAKTPYATVLAEQKYLAGSRGVSSATLRRLSPHGWVIGVETSDGVDKIAEVAKKPPAGGTASVKVTGDVVDVSLTP